MAAASSSSVSNSTSATRSGNNNDEHKASDLLIHYSGAFLDWLPAVRKKAEENLARSETVVKCAQINVWQVLASRKLPTGPGASARKPRLNADVVREICAFLGPVPSRQPIREAEKTRNVVDETRTRDRLRAVDYFLGLFNEEATKGSKTFLVTQEMLDGAPKSTTGLRVDFGVVFLYLWTECGYLTVDARGVHIFEHTLHVFRRDAPALPFRVALHTAPEGRGDVTDVTKMTAMRTTGRLECTGGNAVASRHAPDAGLSEPAKIFVEAIKNGVVRGLEYVRRLIWDAFRNGEPEFVLTEELWQQAPKLPSGKLPPFWRADVEQFSLLADPFEFLTTCSPGSVVLVGLNGRKNWRAAGSRRSFRSRSCLI
mmetsp:Transcript_21495/g.54113  ORF Transcript_21495/g.54113 Transcript_21495/m.54113 type:complete len:370 (+) Transcript_21495:2374-3483(+)